MPSALLYRRNLLGYPAGTRAGVDPTHPAARGLRFSGVAQGSSFLSLTQGRIGTKSGAGTPTLALDGSIGPATQYTATNQDTNFTGQPTTNDGSVTIATIARFNAISGTQTLFSTSTTNAGWRLYLSGGVLSLVAGGVAAVNSSITLSANAPYLIISSVNAATSNFCALRLDTGQIAMSSSTGATPAAPDGTYWVGNNSLLEYSNAKIAAAMFSANFMSLQNMRAWVADPWAFWYPRRTRMFPGIAGGPGVATGTLTATEAPDVAAFTGVVPLFTGTLTAAEAPDTATFTGTVPLITGILTATEVPDVAAFTGVSFAIVAGTLTALEAPDIASFTSTAALGILDATEAPDVASFTGTFLGVPPPPEVLRFGRPVSFRRW